MSKNKTNKTSSPWKFFGLAFLLTWACWIPAGFLPSEQYASLGMALHYAGGAMPLLTTLLLLYLDNQQPQRRDYWRRLADLKRINAAWYMTIFLTVPILAAAGAVFDRLLGGTGAASSFLANPLALLPFAAFTLLFGPLPEEMAWRGYALDGLQNRWNALVASLVLGTAWTLWHLPLFMIAGSYQHSLGVGTPQFWLYMLDKIPQSVLMTWIYNNTRRSTASAVLLHFMINFVGELLDLSLRAEIFYIASWWIMAAIVVAIWKPERLVRIKAADAS